MAATKGRNVVVVGTQWGDEGKGKLVDWLTETATGVVRFQGGHNAGHTVVMTTATNRVLTELTAQELSIDHLIATECEVDAQGAYTGRISGVINMREGKVERLHHWMAEQGWQPDHWRCVAYSDSINDLPLLEAVTHATVTQGDVKLRAEAATGHPNSNLATDRWRLALRRQEPWCSDAGGAEECEPLHESATRHVSVALATDVVRVMSPRSNPRARTPTPIRPAALPGICRDTGG